jgi:ABC-type molybdate transport system permease subunit
MVRAINCRRRDRSPLETVARTPGGSRAWVFMAVTLALALPGIITGYCRSRAVSEFGATITFVEHSGETETLPLAIYSLADAWRRRPGVAARDCGTVDGALVASVADATRPTPRRRA